jgi:hypothetical protein
MKRGTTAPKPRYLEFEPWEVAAMLAGTMTQKRVPHDQWRWPPRPGNLIWVQEPHIEWIGKGRDTNMAALGYVADAGPGIALSLPAPANFKNRHFSTNLRKAKDLRTRDSRLTLEVIETEYRSQSLFRDGEVEAEGLPLLCKWEHENDPMLGFIAFWRRQYRAPQSPVLIIRFRVMQTCVTKLLEKKRGAV